jgi:flagellar motor switch protein FliM
MSKALGQTEIESLLAAAESGQLPAGQNTGRGPSGPPPAAELDVRNYDFKRPERVSKDQMRSLQSLHESFGRNLGASLSGFLRTIIEVRISTLQQLTFSEYIHALPNPTCFNLIEAPPLEGQMCLELSPLIIYPIMDRLLGGSDVDLFIPQRPLTAIELRLVQCITDRALTSLTESWAELAPVRFEMVHTESNPHLAQIVAPNEVVVAIVFEIRMGHRSGTMSLCIPFNVIEPMIARLTSQNWFLYSRRKTREPQGDKLQNALAQARVELQCCLAETEITVHDLLNLQVGDIIQTGKPANHPLLLRVEGRNKFAGVVGQHKGARALKITRRALPDERP